MFIYFDLETTGHQGSPHVTHDKHRIVQACFLVEGEIFDILVHPDMHIPAPSTDIHRVTDDPSRPTWDVAWISVLSWMETILTRTRRQRAFHDTVYLVAHNGQFFDQPVLVKECRRVGVEIPPWIKFLDTLPYFKKNYPERQLHPPASRPFNLGHLYKDLLGKELVGAHDASVDVRALSELIQWTGVPFTVQDTKFRVLSGKSSLVDLKWIGLVRATMIEEYFLYNQYRPKGYKTLKDMQHATRKWTNADMERFLREQVNIKTDGEIISLLSQWRGVPVYDLPYPSMEMSLPRSLTPTDDRDKLIHLKITTPSDLSYQYHSVCQGSNVRFREWAEQANLSPQCCSMLIPYIKKMR